MRPVKSPKKALVLGLTVLLAIGILAGCGAKPAAPTTPATTGTSTAAQGDDSLAKVKAAGKLVFATDSTYPPMEYIDKDGKTIIGFDMDLSAEIAKRLGVTFAPISVSWDGLLPGLVEKKYDGVISSMNVTDERKQQVNFVTYASLDQVFVIRKGDPPVTKLDDLAGKIVAVQKSTTSEDMAKSVKGVKAIDSLDNFDTTFVELKNKKADVIVIDEPVGLYFAKLDPNTFAISGKAAQAMPVGIAIRKEDKTLYDAIQKAVNDMKADGTYKTIAEKWFGSDMGE